MSGSTWILIPVKPLAEAKTRLARLLGAGERRVLVQRMLDDVLAAVTEVAGITGVALVTADPEVAGRGRARALRVLPEPQPGLNMALRHATETLVREGAERLLILPADIPLVNARAVQCLLTVEGAAPAVTLVAASADGGTNALLMAPPGFLNPAFGAGSCARYVQVAREKGVEPRLLDIPEIALDIDRPEDLQALRSRPGAERTREYLDRIQGWARLRPAEQGTAMARQAS